MVAAQVGMGCSRGYERCKETAMTSTTGFCHRGCQRANLSDVAVETDESPLVSSMRVQLPRRKLPMLLEETMRPVHPLGSQIVQTISILTILPITDGTQEASASLESMTQAR